MRGTVGAGALGSETLAVDAFVAVPGFTQLFVALRLRLAGFLIPGALHLRHGARARAAARTLGLGDDIPGFQAASLSRSRCSRFGRGFVDSVACSGPGLDREGLAP